MGAFRDGDGGAQRGAVWILFLTSNGTVKKDQKISDTQGGFTGGLNGGDRFGSTVVNLGGLDDDDGDGVTLAVGTYQDDDGCPPSDTNCNRGALWILLLNDDDDEVDDEVDDDGVDSLSSGDQNMAEHPDLEDEEEW